MVVIDNKRERLCLVSAEGLARETSLCYGATEHRYRTVYAMVRQNIDTGQNQGIVSMTELHIYALKGLAHPRRNTHRDQKCVNSTRVSNPVLVYYL